MCFRKTLNFEVLLVLAASIWGGWECLQCNATIADAMHPPRTQCFEGTRNISHAGNRICIHTGTSRSIQKRLNKNKFFEPGKVLISQADLHLSDM